MADKMRFISPEGRGEVMWVEPIDTSAARVLNVPVWIYGISLGSVVTGTPGRDGISEFKALVEPSPGGTVRCIVPKGSIASQVYLTRIIPDARELGVAIGPSTFLDPRMVAIHLHVKDLWWPQFGEYLNRLVDEGVLQQWEAGDPDEFADERADQPSVQWTGRDLVHPRPDTDVQHHFSI
jgi:hypothetical protein